MFTTHTAKHIALRFIPSKILLNAEFKPVHSQMYSMHHLLLNTIFTAKFKAEMWGKYTWEDSTMFDSYPGLVLARCVTRSRVM
jgi:hypothetical protein